MIKQIEKFVTNDGKEFLEQEEAELYVINQIQKFLNKQLSIEIKLEGVLDLNEIKKIYNILKFYLE